MFTNIASEYRPLRRVPFLDSDQAFALGNTEPPRVLALSSEVVSVRVPAAALHSAQGVKRNVLRLWVRSLCSGQVG